MKFDTHIHTNRSPCSNMRPEKLVEKADKCLDTIVVCDHNEIDGAFRAREICAQESRKLIVELGIEFSTEFGEFGAKFLNESECEQFMAARNEKKKFDFKRLFELIQGMRSDPDPD